MGSPEELQARLTANPQDAEAVLALARYYVEIGDYASALSFTDDWAPHQTPEVAATLYLEGGRVAISLAGDLARAITYFEYVLHYEPAHVIAASELAEALRPYGEFQRIIDTLVQVAGHASQAGSNEDAAALFFRAGKIAEEDVGEQKNALAYYHKAIKAYPALVSAIYAARQIRMARGDTEKATKLLKLEIKYETDSERKSMLLRELAADYKDAGDRENAKIALDAAIALGHNVAAIEYELADVMAAHTASQPAPGGDASPAEPSPERSAERKDAAKKYLSLSQQTSENQAWALLERALDADPSLDDALSSLEALAQESGRTDELPDRWAAYITAIDTLDATRDRRFWLAQARAREGRLADAIAALEPLLEIDDAVAANELYTLYRNTERPLDALRAHRITASSLEVAAQIERMHDLVDSLYQIDEGATALELAQQILQLDPTDDIALQHVRDAYRQESKLEALRDLLVSLASNQGVGADLRANWLTEAAQLTDTELSDSKGAVRVWQQVLEIDPANRDAFFSAERILRANRLWDELVGALTTHLEATADPGDRVELLEKLVQIQRDHRQDDDGLAAALAELYALNPSERHVRDELSEMYLKLGKNVGRAATDSGTG